MSDLVTQYLSLGLALGRHVDGLVDAYYGPPELARRAAEGAPRSPAALADEARALLADLEADRELDGARRHWIAAQVRGLRTTARKLAGEPVGYAEDELAEAHRRIDAVLPGGGPLAERYSAWREASAVPADALRTAVDSLAEDLRARTDEAFGLPEGERIDFDLVTDQPWAGFNYYLGDLRSRVAINVDLPVLGPTLPQLVAHEAYPGHHTEHSRKEVGLVRRRDLLEETIFLVGTPQCLLAEGLADLGLEVVVPGGAVVRAGVAAEHLKPLGVPFDPEVVATVGEAADGLGRARGNVALLLHEEGADEDEAVAYAERWLLLSRPRAQKLVSFLTDPTWRAYMTCYVEGLPLCRRFVDGDPARFERLITEQLTPDQLAAA